LVTISILTS